MSTTAASNVRAVLHLERLKILLLLAGAKTVYTAMLAEVVRFPSPVPSLAMLLGQINTLETTQQVVTTRTGGTVAVPARNAARDTLWASLRSEKAYVQTVADANEPDAVQIIKSAGFDVAAPQPPRSRPILDAKLTVTPGTVKLMANASALAGGAKRRVTYNWQYSLDGGHTWIAVQSTSAASTTVAGLALLTSPSFRVCIVLKGIVQPWSQDVTITVH